MIELQQEFTGTGEVKDFLFKQIKKNEHAFLYEVKVPSDDDDSVKMHYEVFERKISKENDMVMGGVKVHFEEREIYPKSNSFGVWAWTYTDYDKAIETFEEITQNIINRTIKQ